MSDTKRHHPDPADMAAFLEGALGGPEDRTARLAIFDHLIGGCPICRERMAELAGPMLVPGGEMAGPAEWNTVQVE